MNATAIDDLKRLLLTKGRPSEVVRRFFDWWESGGDGEGAPLDRPPPVRAIVERTAAAMLREPVQLRLDAWFRVAEHRLVHGGFSVGARFGQALFFEDLGIGVISVCDLPSGRTDYALFAIQGDPRAN